MASGDGVAAASRAFALDTDDLRAAISWAVDSPDSDDIELALRIVAPFANVISNRRRAAGVAANAARLVERAPHASPALRAGILAGLASDALFIEGDLERAATLARQALSTIAEAPTATEASSTSTMMPYTVLSFYAIAHGRFDEARQAVAQARTLSDTPHHLSFSEMLRGRVELAAGDPVAARQHAQSAVDLARRADFPFRIAQALSGLASAALRDDPSTARAALDEIIAIERSHLYLNQFGGHEKWLLSARICAVSNEHGAALESLRHATVRARDTGVSVINAVGAAFLLADILTDLDRLQVAAVLAGFSLEGPYAPLLPLTSTPQDREEFREKLPGIRAELGDDQYAEAIAHGVAMSLDEIIDYLIRQIDATRSATDT